MDVGLSCTPNRSLGLREQVCLNPCVETDTISVYRFIRPQAFPNIQLNPGSSVPCLFCCRPLNGSKDHRRQKRLTNSPALRSSYTTYNMYTTLEDKFKMGKYIPSGSKFGTGINSRSYITKFTQWHLKEKNCLALVLKICINKPRRNLMLVKCFINL